MKTSSNHLQRRLEKLTHSGPDVTETAESKIFDPKGPTLVFSIFASLCVRSSLKESFSPTKLAA